MWLVKKLASNFAVSFVFVIPNLIISAFGQWFFNVYLGWTAWYSFLGWMISAGSGFAFGVFLAMAVGSNFKFRKWRYSYSFDTVDKAGR